MRRLVLLLLSLLAAAPVHARDERVAQLAERHRKWLSEDVLWIVTKDEREDFLALGNDTERDTFIERFWRLRDPQPLTPENEFRDEHYRRLAYVNKYFASDTARRGFQTDRGRVYILLGKPDDVERTVSANEVYPYEMWFYGNTARLGLPGQLRLIFYRSLGNGEYRLLNPVLEKDRMFPPSTQVNVEDVHELRELVGPEVTQALEGVAPGYGGNTSDEIIQELKSPRQIPERIRDRGLALHPEVRTRLSLERIALPLKTLVVPADDGTALVHLGVELPPSEVSFQEAGSDRFLARVDVFGEITDERGVSVARFDEAAALSVGKDELARRKSNSFAFEAVRALIPGRYKATLMLQDYGRGKLGQAEAAIVVPPPAALPALAPLTVAFRVDRAAAATAGSAAPFTVGGFRIHSRAGQRYRRGEPLYAFGLLQEAPGEPRDLEVDLELRHEATVAFHATARSEAAQSQGGLRPILLAFATGALAPGRYEVALAIRAGTTPVATATAPLEITEQGVPPGYFLYTEKKNLPPEVEHFNRGVQLLSKGDLAPAQQHFRIAQDLRPNFRPASVYLARTLLLSGRTDEAVALLDKVLAADPDNYDGLVTRGSLQLQRGDFAGAASSLGHAAELGARTKELLNGLAEAAVGLKDIDAARRYLRQSLEQDTKQDAVRKRLQELGG